MKAFSELGRIANRLKVAGMDVVREKIETTPWRPNAPKTSLDRLSPGNYFECHFTLPDMLQNTVFVLLSGWCALSNFYY